MASGGSSELIKFHESCKDEFVALLKSFNILFYGYGCKENLLARLFPESRIYNMYFHSVQNIIDDLVLECAFDASTTTFSEIDSQLKSRSESLLLILLNFTFGVADLKRSRSIRLIATVEQTNFTFTLDELKAYEFVLRDLTTFEDYADETSDMELTSSKVDYTMQVVNSVSKNARRVFRDLIEIGNCSDLALFDKVKFKMMLSRRSSLLNFLAEFIDHDIVKIKDKNQFQICLSSKERKSVMERMDAMADL